MEEHLGTSFLWQVESHAGCNPPLLSLGRLDGRSQASLRVSKELITDDDLDIFLRQYDTVQSEHDREGRDYLDILGRPRLLNDWRVFNAEALAYVSEPSATLFNVLNRALECSGDPVEGFEPDFKKLLSKLSASRQLLDALLTLETPEQVKQNPDGLVATWISDYFHEVETGTGRGAGTLGFQDAGIIIPICVHYQNGFNMVKRLVFPCPIFASLGTAHNFV